jgi:hypothetical protein
MLHHPDRIAQAVVETVAYADIFEYPVTMAEIHRYLIGCQCSFADVERIIQDILLPQKSLETHEDLFFLPGRTALIELRRQRDVVAQQLWKQAIRYGRWMTHLPFVRMVAITGALASSNVEAKADLDYLIITAPDFLWLCRAFVLALIHLTAPFGARICPNYLLTTRELKFDDEILFTAQEFSRMVPISGYHVYQELRKENGWTTVFLPNVVLPTEQADFYEPRFKPLQAIVEPLLKTPLGRLLENWERTRKIAQLTRQAGGDPESYFSTDCCKGHFERHGARTMAAYENKIKAALERA